MYAPIERPMINDVDPLLLHFRKVSIVLPFFPRGHLARSTFYFISFL